MNLTSLIVFTLVAATFGGSANAQSTPANAAVQAKKPVIRLGTKPQEMLLTKITVSDLPKSYDFYTKVLGLKLVTSTEMPLAKAPSPSDPEKDFVEIPLNYSGSLADPTFLLVKKRGDKPSPEYAKMVYLGFKVPDKKAVVERAAQAGYKLFRGGVGEGEAAFIADPDGYTLEIFSVPSFEQK